MACPDLAKLRNIGIIAHIDAGKTTLSERILFYCQKIHKLGEVHDGAATMDFLPEEQERGITIASACTTCEWNKHRINLIDTPGHVDFTMEVERCLRVLDGAVGVFCAVGGVEPQSETVWRQSEEFKVPKIAFINKMDRTGANFEAVLGAMEERLFANPCALVIPAGQGESFEGVIDILAMEKLTFDAADQGRTVLKSKLGENEKAAAETWREKLFDKLGDADDMFLSAWLEGCLTENDIKNAIAKAAQKRQITPVFCGSALRNAGVQPLLDGICRYLPSPLQCAPAIAHLPNGSQAEIVPDASKETLGLVFKVSMENARKNCFLRLYSGKLREGDLLFNARTAKQERVGRLFRMHADRREQLDELCAGDIAQAAGFKDASTGDTLRSKNSKEVLEPINSYDPVLTLALEPRNADEGKILDEALSRYLEEDPTLKLVQDEDSGIRMLSGMGELHLEVLLERLEREYKIRPRTGQPQAVLKETITAAASASVNFDKELGKERHQGEVELAVEPKDRSSGNEIAAGSFLPEDKTQARKLLPLPMQEAVREGISDGLMNGILGWPVTDIKVTITNIKKTDGLTTLPGLRMAAALALRAALESAAPVTLEPVMSVEMTTPEEYLGAVINLFNQAGGKVENLEDTGGIKRVCGDAPLRNLFGFSTRLRSATQGRAGFMLTFRTFDQV